MAEHNHPENMNTTACVACVEEARTYIMAEDIYSLNSALAAWLAPRLRRHREELHGCPPKLCGDSGDIEAGMVQWRAILDEMAEGFEEFAKEGDMDCPKLPRSVDLLHEWFFDLWD